MKSIGENIAALRKRKEMTQEALAAEIGVSAQAVSKWENGTNMPDIQLMPMLADIFNVSLDELYGRKKHKNEFHIPEVFEECCESVMDIIGTAFYDSMRYDPQQGVEVPALSVDDYIMRYKAQMKSSFNGILRSGIVQKDSVVYYRQQFGGLLMRKPECGWAGLFEDEAAVKLINLLADSDFRVFLAEVLKSEKTTFTASSICRRCGIENIAALEEKLAASEMFMIRKVEIDEKEVSIYDLIVSDRMFLIFNILLTSKEFVEYRSSYYNYSGTADYMYG